MVVILEKIENRETGISNTSVNGYNYNPFRSTISNEVSDTSMIAYVRTNLYNEVVQSVSIDMSFDGFKFSCFHI